VTLVRVVVVSATTSGDSLSQHSTDTAPAPAVGSAGPGMNARTVIVMSVVAMFPVMASSSRVDRSCPPLLVALSNLVLGQGAGHGHGSGFSE